MKKEYLTKDDIVEINNTFKITGIITLIMIMINIIMFFSMNYVSSQDFDEYQDEVNNVISDINSFYSFTRSLTLAVIVFWSYYFVLFKIAEYKSKKHTTV